MTMPFVRLRRPEHQPHLDQIHHIIRIVGVKCGMQKATMSDGYARKVQAMHDTAVEAGALCDDPRRTDNEDEDKATKALDNVFKSGRIPSRFGLDTRQPSRY